MSAALAAATAGIAAFAAVLALWPEPAGAAATRCLSSATLRLARRRNTGAGAWHARLGGALGGAGLAGAAALVAGAPVLAAIGAACCAVAARSMLARALQRRRAMRLAEALLPAVEAMARTPSTSLADTLAAGAAVASGTLRDRLAEAAAALRAGLPPDRAVACLATDASAESAALALLVATNARTGGRPGPALTALADTIAARRAHRQKCRSLAAEARMSAWIIGMLPGVYLAAAHVVSPDYVAPLFTTAAGRLVLLAAAAWLALGVLVMRIMAAET